MIARASHLAATARPLFLERRHDIDAESLLVRGQRWWRLKDPLRLQFWQLGEEEHFLWEQLEGDVSLQDLEQRFRQRFAPRRIELAHLHQFLGTLHREGLVYSTAAGQGTILLERQRQRTASRRWQGWTNLLAIRFRGIDPTRLLEWLYPLIAWIFSPAALLAFGLLIGSAVLLAVIAAGEILARMPQASEFLTSSNLLWLAATLGVVKVCHELGHALVCRHFGGRCHELGLMLLIFTPCLYCNVSDAWLLPSRWRRMAISAAGMFVELTLAAAATWLWWFSEPGLFSTLCLNVMVVCSINTVLFNGNPLLRFDGYFLLSDFLDMPNLRQASAEWLQNQLGRVLLGIRTPAGPALGSERLPMLATYAVASVAYRLCLTAFVWWFIYQWLAELRLAVLGAAIVGLSAVTMIGQATWNGWQMWSTARRERRIHRGRATWSLLVAGLIVGLIGLVPISRSVTAPAVVRPANADTVYVTISGTLTDSAVPGTRVEAGDIIAELRNPELEHQLLQLAAERDVLRQQAETLKRQQVQTPGIGVAGVSGQLRIVEQQLADVVARLEQKRSDQEQLTIRAPRGGVILSARALHQETPSDELQRWQGTPLDPENTGCFLEPGDVLCHVGEPEQREAFVVVEQSEIDVVHDGQSVTVQLDELAQTNLSGTVRRVAELSAAAAPPELAARHRLPLAQDVNGPRLLGTYYQVMVELDAGPPVPLGASGLAKIHVPPQTLAARLYDFLCRTFRA